eukprot:6452244-Ditylum_brightwellii.AAC.1
MTGHHVGAQAANPSICTKSLHFTHMCNISYNNGGEGQTVLLPFSRIFLDGGHPINESSIFVVLQDFFNPFQDMKICMPGGSE